MPMLKLERVVKMDKPEFLMLVGLPGSGKSTYIKKYFNQNLRVHSSDAIRAELSGDENNQDINAKVFEVLHNRVKEDLRNGISCVYDATNINYKRRKAFLDELKSIDCWKVCHVICTPYEVCLEQNQQRERKVPEEVIERMYRNFDIPYWYEGWDDIELWYEKESYKTAYNHWGKFLFDTMDFNQDNKYHTETLGEHCRRVADYVIKNYREDLSTVSTITMSEAAFLHDCGKPFCKQFKDSKGNETQDAHYYDHEHVGSYNSLFYQKSSPHTLYIAVLIRWHMQMHFIDKQPHTAKKYEDLLGTIVFQDLQFLHKADKSGH